MQYTLTIVLIFNVILKIFMSMSLQYLWDYINSLQMVALIPLMNLSIAPNLYALLGYFSGPLSFNYWDQTHFAEKVFQLDPDNSNYTSYSENFADFGFDTNLAALSLQDTLIYLSFCIIGTPFTLLVVRMKFLHKYKVFR